MVGAGDWDRMRLSLLHVRCDWVLGNDAWNVLLLSWMLNSYVSNLLLLLLLAWMLYSGVSNMVLLLLNGMMTWDVLL